MDYRGFRLDPFQEQAIAALDQGSSLIVSAPTGAGKTLIAEYAIERAMERGRQVIYTAPIKALSNQKFRDFSARYPQRIGLLTGDVSINYGAPGLIMTTEIFRNTLLEDPGRVRNVDHVIFDEFHYIHDMERGTVWEESIIFAPESIRFICLSATMPNIQELAEWMARLRNAPVEAVVEDKRPVPLEHALWVDGHGIRSLKELARLLKGRGKRQRRGGRRGFGAEALLDHVEHEQNLPCLYFCFNRRLCEARAEANAARELLSPAESREISLLYSDLCRRFEVGSEPSALRLGRMVRRGVAFHHAGILPTLKEVVERLFTSGLIKMLFATETFALGVNMPARTVVIDSLMKYHGTHFGYLRSREYNQMAGRAGRRGMDECGFVFSRVDVDEVTQDGVQRVITGRPERIESQFNLSYCTILSLYQRWGRQLIDVCDRSFASHQQRQVATRSKKGAKSSRLSQSVLRRLDVLKALGYLHNRGLTHKGRFALQIPGFELQATELYAGGCFERLDIHEINVLVSAVVHEGRAIERGRHAPRRLLEGVRKRASRLIQAVHDLERAHGVQDPIRILDFRLGSAVHVWSRKADFSDLTSYTPAAEGDIIRTLRMTIQILRQLTKACGDPVLKRKFARASQAINRGPVDAERQLRAGCEADAT